MNVKKMRLKLRTITWTLVLLFLIYIVTNLIMKQRDSSTRKKLFPREKEGEQHNAKKSSKFNNFVAKVKENSVTGYDLKGSQGKKDEAKTSSEVQHVAFLKVHKTASSTAQNVFLRFGDSRNLNFILAHTKGESGWLNVISYTNSITKENIVPPPPGNHFDLLCCHVIYNRKRFEDVLPVDTVYIGIVREPISRFQSAVRYFSSGFILRLPGEHPVSKYADDPVKYEPSNPVLSQTNNRMAAEFGFPIELFPGKSLNGSKVEINNYLSKLDEEFKFIIISEMFDESMVYMRRILKWKLKDILYVNLNVAPKRSNPKKTLQPGDAEKLNQFLYLDIALYDFAVKRFQKQMKLEGDDILQEIEHFKAVRQSVQEFCEAKSKQSLLIEDSSWNQEFNIELSDCILFSKHEKTFLQRQRLRMYGTTDN